MGTQDVTESIQTQGTCSDCKRMETHNNLHTALSAIGTRVTDEVILGRGNDRTNYRFLQCSLCGSVWVKYDDSGAGGHGHFLKRLTADLY